MRLFQPKVAKQEYTTDMLPTTRKQVFFDVVKLHFLPLLLCGLCILLFALPLHISALYEDSYLANLNGQITADTTQEELERLTLLIVSFSNTRGLINIVFYAFFAVGLSGIARVIRQYAWEENVYFRYDFIKGIGQNYRQMLLLGLIVGVLCFISTYVKNLSSLIAQEGIYEYLGIIPSIFFALLLIPVGGYAVVCISVYNNKFSQNIRTGFVLYFKRIWKTLLAAICCLAVFVPQMIPNFYCHLIGRIISSLLVPFVMLAWFLFSYNGLDKSINPTHSPQLIGKGLATTHNEQVSASHCDAQEEEQESNVSEVR